MFAILLLLLNRPQNAELSTLWIFLWETFPPSKNGAGRLLHALLGQRLNSPRNGHENDVLVPGRRSCAPPPFKNIFLL
jgi:hypothetical protein